MPRKVPNELFCSETEIARRVLGPARAVEWREKAKELERGGLPQIDPFMGGRYWPAIRAFFDRQNGVADKAAAVPTSRYTFKRG
jgi:hypothetical protein